MISLDRKGFGFAFAAGVIGVLASIEACGGSPTGGGVSNGNNGNDGGSASPDGAHPTPHCARDGGTNSVSKTAGSCANPTIPIEFSPMYSAYIPGETLRSFSIPAVTSDGCPMTWSVSDPTQVTLHANSFVNGGATTPGVMITTTAPGGSGKVTVFATASDGTCGSSVLTITQNTKDDWTIGSARYNQGVSLHLGGAGAPDSGFVESNGGSFLASDAGTPCTTCHSQTVKTGQFTDVAHTPEQAGGFSDTDMKNIIVNGEVPDGGYFDPAVINATCTGSDTKVSPNMSACAKAAYAQFQGLHKWSDISSDQIAGMICYLRSLTPEGQSGTSNF